MVTDKYDAKVFSSTPHTLKGLCKRVNVDDAVRQDSQTPPLGTVRESSTKFPGTVGGPIWDKREYVPQRAASRAEERMCEGMKAPGHLAAHCKKCECEPQFEETVLGARSHSRPTREVIEALSVASGSHGTYINQPSELLRSKEIHLLQKDAPRATVIERGGRRARVSSETARKRGLELSRIERR